MTDEDKLAEVSRRDPIGSFDPYLAAIGPKGDAPHYRGGYKIWPHPRAAEAAQLRLMSMGNSTSLWPGAEWSRELAELLKAEGLDVGLYHGAGKGNTSVQEVMRVMRDAPAIKPDMIIMLSGICDIGHLLNAKGYPFAHKYVRRILDFALTYGFVNETTYGYPDPISPAQSWCRNQRMARVLADDMGIPIIVFLQPTQGVGAYDMTPDEQEFFAQKASVVLRAIDKPYGQCVTEFYEEVRAIMAADPESYDHIVDFTDVFADCPGAYRDHRHQTRKGVTHLAKRMLPSILAAVSGRVKGGENATGQSNDNMPDATDLAARTTELSKVLDQHTNNNDKIGHFDPLLSAISPPSGHKRLRGGYKLWPEDGPDPSKTLRLMTMGNSTSVWPHANWSEQLAERLTADGTPLTLFHSAGKGSTSSQEVLRVLRDAPGIMPHLIVSLSGITDIGYLLSTADNPYSHKYTRRVMNFLRDTEMVRNVVYGYPNKQSPARNWCYNQRMARALADKAGIPIIVFLQPTQGVGAYDMTPDEQEFFAQKASVVLRAIDKPYGQCVTEFYEEVRAIMAADPESYDHIVDFTDVFADCPGAYRDHRHQTRKGVTHLAKRMEAVVKDRIKSKPDATRSEY